MGERIEQMEAYHKGTMPETEREAFQQALQTDITLREQWNQYLKAQALLDEAVSLRLKRQMQQMERPAAVRKSLISSRMRWVLVAASVALLLVSALWWGTQKESSYLGAYEPYALSGVRGRSVPGDDWVEAYNAGEYAKAYGILQAIDQMGAEEQFYQASAALALGKAAEAIVPLKEVINAQSLRYGPAAEWYLLLAYWGNGQMEEARQMADQILQTPGHAYREKVETLPWM